MTLIDFFIGLTLMNAMPHFVLGIWKGRAMSGFGFGNTQNILYGLFNFSISAGLYLYEYGTDKFFENGIYIGALAVLVTYLLTGQLQYKTFNKKKKDK